MVRVRTLTFLTAVAMAIAFAVAATWAVAPPGGPTEGVGVHGHWTIDVHDPDGSLAASHEFENALVGPGVLTGVLSGENPATLVEGVPDWIISVVSDSGGPCVSGLGDTTQCIIGQEGSTWSLVQFHTLEVSKDFEQLSLQGTFEPDDSGDIIRVATSMMTDLAGDPLEVTKKQFSADDGDPATDPVTVSAGQFVTVTVDISFSDAPA